MKILGVIPARGGSKGVPRKNIRLLCGKPLVQWTIECALASNLINRLIVTSDDEDVIAVARRSGVDVPFTRPKELATDESPMLDVIRHALTELAPEYVPDAIVILQPTSPLRRPEHIAAAVDALEDADSVCSVVALPKEVSPHFVMRIGEDGYLRHFLEDGARYTRRQDVPSAYRRDGTIYLVRHDTVQRDGSLYGNKCVPLFLETEASLSIDDEADWDEAERRLKAMHPSDSRRPREAQ